MDIELRHLRSFVAVATELNFTRAAKRLFIAQQALSTQIRQLEESIGTQLLVRTTRSVALTPAGEALYAKARLLLSEAEAAVEATRVAAGGPTSLTVGFVAAVDHRAVSHALDRFSESSPGVEVLVRFGDLLDPTGGLRDKAADVAFVYGPFDQTGLDVVPLFEEPVGIAMAATHHLASRKAITVDDAIAEPTFDFPTPDRAWRSFWNLSEYRNDRAPKVVARFHTLEGLLAALTAGLGVNLATQTLVIGQPGLVWKPLAGVPPLVHGVARRSDDERSVVHDFVDVVRTTFTA